MASESLYDRLQATAQAWVESYNQAHATGDMNHLSSTLTPDCRRYFAPPTLIDLVPSLADGMSNQGFETREAPNFASMDVSVYSIKELTIDERQRKVVVHANRHAQLKDGRKYDFEQMNTLWMTEDGGRMRISRIVQFVDTLVSKGYMDQTESGAKVKDFRE